MVCLNILTKSIAITDSMFNFFTKNVIAFDLTKIERKKIIIQWHEILLRIQWCHQKYRHRKKKINFFPMFFSIKS